jgi:hypothetical protein
MKHVVRAGLLLCFGVVALVLGRSLFLPESWAQFGSYRGANVAEQRDHPVRHGGNESCRACHEEESDTLAEAGHESLACESCHAPLAVHARGDETIGEMPVRRSSELCNRCHQALDARPAQFPQINPKQHVEENGEQLSATVCFECHEAHSPL